jgi:hypothetical protein
MKENKFSIYIICAFTHFMWNYVMGLTTPFQVRNSVTTNGNYIELIR